MQTTIIISYISKFAHFISIMQHSILFCPHQRCFVRQYLASWRIYHGGAGYRCAYFGEPLWAQRSKMRETACWTAIIGLLNLSVRLGRLAFLVLSGYHAARTDRRPVQERAHPKLYVQPCLVIAITIPLSKDHVRAIRSLRFHQWSLHSSDVVSSAFLLIISTSHDQTKANSQPLYIFARPQTGLRHPASGNRQPLNRQGRTNYHKTNRFISTSNDCSCPSTLVSTSIFGRLRPLASAFNTARTIARNAP